MSPQVHPALLCTSCSLSPSLSVRTVAEISPHFIFTAGGCLVFLGFLFFSFCKYGTYGSSHSPKAGPLRHSSPWFMCVCACVSSCQSLRKDRYESVGGFLKLPFLYLCSQISECRWEAVLKWLILSSVHVCLCVGGKLEGMFVWTPQTVYKSFTWPLWHYPLVLNSGFWSFNVSPLADDMLGFLKPEVTVVVSETIDLSSTPYSLL